MLAPDFRDAFNSVEGVLSATGGGVMGVITLEFLDKELLNSFKEYGYQMNVNFCDINYKMAEGADVTSIDFKQAGKRLGARMREVVQKFNAGDSSDLLPSELKLKEQFPSGLTAHNRKIRISIEDCVGMDDYKLVLDFRRKLKVYITETLELNIVPDIWRACPDGWGYTDLPVVETYILTVVLCNCSERLYQACEEYADLVFKNTLFNFQLASRKDLWTIKPTHKFDDYGVIITCKTHGAINKGRIK